MPKKTSKRRKSTAPNDKYRHPIPGNRDLLALLAERGEPMTLERLARTLDLKTGKHLSALGKKLKQLVQQGQVIKNRRSEYLLVAKTALITGAVSAHRDGFGFLLRDDGKDDVYLSGREMRSLFNGDRIAVRLTSRPGSDRTAGKLVEVLERRTTEIAGKLVRERGITTVVPDNPSQTQQILIPARKTGGAKPGQFVVVKIIDYPTAATQATGEVVGVIGDPGDQGIASELAIHAHNIPHRWSNAVQAEAATFGSTVKSAAKKDRVDLRGLALVTIDGADARDFDDAVYAEPTADGYRLVVAIADVAHYVEPGSPLDDEAQRRGTSVYFPDRVVPMLPEALSNGLCSLKPKVDRLALVCDMQIDSRGTVKRSEFYNAVIRSARRLTYTDVHAFLDGGKRPAKIDRAVATSLEHLGALYTVLATARDKRGALEIDIPQLRIDVGADGEVRGIRPIRRNDAHRLIEECMIAANVEAAKYLGKHRLQALYRVHAGPRAARFDEFREYVLTLGYKVPLAEDVQPRDFKRLLADIRQRPDAHSIAVALLRSMAHAEYTPDNSGHFGLALKRYAHFTSPIRRYPDLLVHRAIKYRLAGGKPAAYQYSHDDMTHLGKQSSATERRAEDATREVEAVLKCQFMVSKVGQVYVGRIATVTPFGLFVLLDELNVEGLIHVATLQNDYYEYDAAEQSLIGARRGQRFSLGQTLRVRVEHVDLEQRHIDFALVKAT
ncbi:MAG: ribonuclease R [Pseudomonadota bacterium]